MYFIYSGIYLLNGVYLEEGNGNPLQCSCLENSMNRGAWQATVHGVTESDTTEQLTDLIGTGLFPDVCSYVLTLPVVFTPRAELPSTRWQAAVNHTAGLQVPAPRGPVFFYCMFPSSDIQRFCHSSESLLCAPWTQKLSFGRTDLNLTCGRGEAWTWTKHYCTQRG